MKRFISTSAICATALLFSACDGGLGADALIDGLVQKEISNHQISSDGFTGTVDWHLSHVFAVHTEEGQNTSNSIIMTDIIGNNQTFVTGSEQHPDGWTFNQSGNQLIFSGDAISPINFYVKDLPSINNLNGTTNGSGDGYMPIPYYSGSSKKIFVVNRHEFAPQNNSEQLTNQDNNTSKPFECFDLNNGLASCASFPKKLPDGDPSSSALNTPISSANDEFQIVGNKLYYAVTRYPDNETTPKDWGLGCYNVDTDQECGYWQYSDNPENKNVNIGIEGPYRVNDKLYTLDVDMNVWCHDTATSQNCAGDWPISLSSSKDLGDKGLPPIESVSKSGGIGAIIVEGKIYFSVIHEAKHILCFDTDNASADYPANICGWSGVKAISSPERKDNFSNYLYKDSSLAPLAFCLRNELNQECIKLSDGSAVILPDVAFGTPLAFGLGKEVSIEEKSYFPSWAETKFSDLYCWDWSQQAACQNSPLSSSSLTNTPLVNSLSNIKNYSSAKDKFGCMWFFGENHKLWSLNPAATTSPCNYISYEDTVKKPKSCSTTDGVNWDYITVKNITVSDFSLLELYLFDSNDNIINGAGIDLLTGNDSSEYELPLNTAPYSTLPEIKYQIKAQLAEGISTYTTTPSIQVRSNVLIYDFCYKTEYKCPVDTISNYASLEVNGNTGDSSSSETVSTASLCEKEPTDIGISKKAIKPESGNPNTVTFELSFSGSLPAGQSIEIEDIVPANSTFVSITPGDWNCSSAPLSAGQDMTCDLSGQAYSAIPSITIEMETTEDEVKNCASIVKLEDIVNSNPDNDESCDTVAFPPPASDIGITKKVTGIDAGNPNQVKFEIAFTGSLPAGETILIEDVVPADGVVTYNSGTWDCSPASNISAGQTLSCEITGPHTTIPIIGIEMTSNESQLKNCASITKINDNINSDTSNDTSCDTAIIDPPAADIGISKTVIESKPGSPNHATFQLSFSGSLPADQTIIVEDIAPENSTITGVNASPWNCLPTPPIAAGQTISCQLVGPHESIPPIDIIVETKNNTIRNCASISKVDKVINSNTENDKDCSSHTFNPKP